MAVKKVIELEIKNIEALRDVEALGVALTDVKTEAKEAAKAIDDLGDADLSKSVSDLVDMGIAIESASNAADDLDQSLGRVDESAAAAADQIDNIDTSKLDDAASSADSFAGSMSSINSEGGFDGISKGISVTGQGMGLLTAATVVSGAAVTASTKKIVESVGKAFKSIQDYSGALQFSIERAKELVNIGKEMAGAFLTNKKLVSENSDELKLYARNLARLNVIQEELLELEKDLENENKDQLKQYKALIKEVEELNKEQEKLNKSTDRNTAETEQNTKAKKKNADATDGSTSATGAFKEEADGVFDSFIGGIPVVGSLLLRLKGLLLSPIGAAVTFISAIIALPAALSASTQEGQHFIDGFVTPLKSGLEGILGELQSIANSPGGWTQIWGAILGAASPLTIGQTTLFISNLGVAYDIAKKTGGEIAGLVKDLSVAEASRITAISKLSLTQAQARTEAEDSAAREGETQAENIKRRLTALDTYKASSEGIAAIQKDIILQELEILKLAATLSDTTDEDRAEIARKAAELDEALIRLSERTREYEALRRSIVGEGGGPARPAATTIDTPAVDYALIETNADTHRDKELKAWDEYWKAKAAGEQMSADITANIEKSKNDALLDGALKVGAALVNVVEAFSEDSIEVQKGAAIAGVLIDGAAAGLAAYRAYMAAAAASGGTALPAAKIALAAELTAIGLNTIAAIKTISSASLDSETETASTGSAATTGPSFNIIEANSNNQLAQTVSGFTEKPTRAYLVSSEVLTEAAFERQVRNTATT